MVEVKMMHDYDMKSLTGVNNKVDKVSGKGLSSNDFTSAYKTKLDISQVIGTAVTSSNSSDVYTATITGVTYTHGVLIMLLNNRSAANNDECELNVNGLGNKPIYYKNRKIKAGEFPYRNFRLFMYNTWDHLNSGQGSWVMIDSIDENTTYAADNSSLQLNGTTFGIKNSGVSTDKIKDYNVSRIKIADDAINLDKIDSSVFGTGSGTIAEGNHTHNVGTASGKVVVTGSGGSLTTNDVVVLTATFSDGNSANYKLLGS